MYEPAFGIYMYLCSIKLIANKSIADFMLMSMVEIKKNKSTVLLT